PVVSGLASARVRGSMVSMMASLTKRFLSIPEGEVSFERRGFRGGSLEARERIESIGRAALLGYHLALENRRPLPLGRALDAIDPEYRGFSYEGAAMALAILDAFTPWGPPRRTSPSSPAPRRATSICLSSVSVGRAPACLSPCRASSPPSTRCCAGSSSTATASTRGF